MCELKSYDLRIDGQLLRKQRRLLLNLIEKAFGATGFVPEATDDRSLLEGTIALLDEIADQAHDRHGIDCLEPEDGLGECEKPGYSCSGIPGILAHLEDGQLPEGAAVDRCDLCPRYPSDEASRQKLQELGHVAP